MKENELGEQVSEPVKEIWNTENKVLGSNVPNLCSKIEITQKNLSIDVSAIIKEDAETFERSAFIGWFLGKRLTRAEIRCWVEKNWGHENLTNFLPKGFFVTVFKSEII